MFYKFNKGKAIYSLPNGLGDGSAYFNKSIARMTTGLNVLPSGTSPSTISCWFRYKQIERDYDQIVAYGSQNNSSMRGLLIHDNMLYSWGYLNDRTYENTNIEVNKWYHVVMIHENAKEKVYLNGVFVSERDFSFNTTAINEVCIGKHGDSYYFCGNITNIRIFNRALTEEEVTQLYNKRNITDGLALYIPLTYGKDDSMFSEKTFVYDYSIVETSSGFNAMGKPVGYRSASGAGIAYSPIDIPKDGLVFYADYKNGKDRVTKTQGECNNVDFIKYKGCNCAYFNGVNSSILWKNILTSDLQYYTIFTKFAALPKEHWGMIFGLSPENKRTQGYSMKTHYNSLTYCHRGNDRGGVSIPFDTWGVGVLVGYGEWIELYYNGEVNVGYSAGSIPANSWLYNGIDFGYTNVDPQPYYGYIAESIVYNRTFSKDELQALTQQLLNKGA